MHLFFSSGEPSGDHHAAQVMRELHAHRPDIRFSGFGGPESKAAGQDSLFQLTDLAVMGIAGVVPLIQTFRRLVREAAERFREDRPDAVVLVDFPGFNWHVAKAAKAAGIPVYFYCPPQLWAWAPWRIRKVRRLIDCILSVLPFEAEWYRKREIDVEYVGHPFFDEVAAHQLNQPVLETIQNSAPRRVAVLPGSRRQEVNRNFPVMLGMIKKLTARHPDVRFAVGCYREWHQARCEELLAAESRPLPVDLYLRSTPEVLEGSDCCLMVSGSVSLEVLARRKPAVVMYRAGLFTYAVGCTMRTCDYMSLPNLVADRCLMPEFAFMRKDCRHVRKMTRILDGWLTDAESMADSRNQICELADRLVAGGGVARAAHVLLHRVEGASATPGEGEVPAPARRVA